MIRLLQTNVKIVIAYRTTTKHGVTCMIL